MADPIGFLADLVPVQIGKPEDIFMTQNSRTHSRRAAHCRRWLARALVLAASLLPAVAPAQAAAAENDIPQRRELCIRSIALSGLDQVMDTNIREAVEDSFRTLSAAFPDETDTISAYRDSLAEAMSAAKGPVLSRLRESCAAAFSVEELTGINAFYESNAGRAWLEKSRTLMIPALEKAVSDVTPEMIVDAQRRFCARVGGCKKEPAIPPAHPTL
ncbi:MULTISPECIES: DUF2059 domain-containing protein [Sphingomonadaceae]|uniref:DUF2059 domain-containing protein n=1 Tax=Sphingomonadales TaxID=204457 RepID=UPI00082FBD1F|nr:DUF2059 domain-containing protein [Sphingobium sp. TKS]MCF8706706.1 DUF2059 domain-containing protein [Rhizorhapis sp. SPR117]